MEMHSESLTQIALVISVAAILGLALIRLRQPSIVGFILAGIILGPTGAGFIVRSESIQLLAELGVIVLLFLIGMELSLKGFRQVLWPAVITASLQIIAALAITFTFAQFLGWTPEAALLLGFVVALSSTAVAVKMLDDIGELRTETGQITVGVLIAQDIAVVPMLIFASALGGGDIGYEVVIKIALAFALLVGLILWLSRRGKLPFPWADEMHGRTDLISLAALGICFTAAAISGVLGLSAAYGAFMAGLVVGNSVLRADMVRATEPIQSVLIVVFFLSIGLLIDLEYIVANLWAVLTFVFGVIVVKTVFNIAVLRLVGQPWERAFPAGLMISQIGEFSFILAAIGVSGRVIDFDAYRLAISVIAMSLILSPLWMLSVRRFHDAARGGIKDIRDTLQQVYGEEIERIGTATALARHLAAMTGRFAGGTATGLRRSVTRAGNGARLALPWRRGKAESEDEQPTLQLSAPKGDETEGRTPEDRRE